MLAAWPIQYVCTGDEMYYSEKFISSRATWKPHEGFLAHLHSIVDGHACGHDASRRVDIQMNGLSAFLRFEE